MIESAGPMVMLRASDALWAAGVVVSRTLTTKAKVPAVEGVPEMVPAMLRLSPVGREPEAIDQLYGVVPPVAAKVCE